MTDIAALLAGDFETEVTGDHYVATKRITEERKRLFSAMTAALKSPDERVGIWISGPPGSGKSSFAKNLGYVLANADKDGASFNPSIPYQIFPVSLRAELAVEAHAEHIAEAMYRAPLRELDYTEDYDLSELEMGLEKEQKLASFEDLCRAEYKQEWRDIRQGSEKFVCASLLLRSLAPETYHSTEAWLRAIQAQPSRRPGVKDLVERAFELRDVRRPGRSFAFLIDEIGPYKILGAQRIENLRMVVEQFGRESLKRLKAGKIQGPAWIIVTALEKLEEVSNHLSASRITRSKLRDHFSCQIDLAPADIREVVAHRVLRKKESQQLALRNLFRHCGASLVQNVRLERCSRHTHVDEDEFVRFYPFLPHLIDLSMEIIAGIRLHPNRPKGIGNLTIIQVASDMFFSNRTRLADQPVGALVSIDKIYELVEADIPLEKRKEIRDIRQRFDNDENHSGMAGRVAKTICLLEFVKADLPRTAQNIAALLIQNVSEAPPNFAVAKILHELQEAQFARESEGGWTLYDFDELRRLTAALKDLRNAVGAVNPRPPGWRNNMIQAAKKVVARFLSWYTGPLYEFNASVSRSLEEVVRAVDHLTTNLVALDRSSMKQAFEHLSVDMAGLEEQLGHLDQPNAPVAEPLKAHVTILHQQMKALVNMQEVASTASLRDEKNLGRGRDDMQGRDIECTDRTLYIVGLFGTGRRYINELMLQNIGERAKYFRDGIRLHSGPTPMIYSGHVTTKYPSRAQEVPAVMRYILESVKSRSADLMFVYRHPLDSLLTNWVWWRTFIWDNRTISGISEVYKNSDDLCADLEEKFSEFESFAAGDSTFFSTSPGPRFLSFPEFVEETELQLQSARLALRLEDFMIDPRNEFSKILELMSLSIDSAQLSLVPPRSKPYGHVAVMERVPQFRDFIDRLNSETKTRIANIGYNLSC
jgi:hypothetical protein